MSIEENFLDTSKHISSELFQEKYKILVAIGGATFAWFFVAPAAIPMTIAAIAYPGLVIAGALRRRNRK